MDKEFVLEISTSAALVTCAIDNAVIKHRMRRIERETKKMRKQLIVTSSAAGTTAAGCFIMGIQNRMFRKRISNTTTELSEINKKLEERITILERDYGVAAEIKNMREYLNNRVHPMVTSFENQTNPDKRK